MDESFQKYSIAENAVMFLVVFLPTFKAMYNDGSVESHRYKHDFTKHVHMHKMMFPPIQEYIIVSVSYVREVGRNVRGSVFGRCEGSLQGRGSREKLMHVLLL